MRMACCAGSLPLADALPVLSGCPGEEARCEQTYGTQGFPLRYFAAALAVPAVRISRLTSGIRRFELVASGKVVY